MISKEFLAEVSSAIVRVTRWFARGLATPVGFGLVTISFYYLMRGLTGIPILPALGPDDRQPRFEAPYLAELWMIQGLVIAAFRRFSNLFAIFVAFVCYVYPTGLISVFLFNVGSGHPRIFNSGIFLDCLCLSYFYCVLTIPKVRSWL